MSLEVRRIYQSFFFLSFFRWKRDRETSSFLSLRCPRRLVVRLTIERASPLKREGGDGSIQFRDYRLTFDFFSEARSPVDVIADYMG